MRKIKIEDIILWIIIAAIVAIAVWKIVGSPTDTATLISISLFIVASEILLWKAILASDKKVTVSFMRIKNDLDNNNNQLNNRLDKIENLINKIK
jgi:hypothetical protein